MFLSPENVPPIRNHQEKDTLNEVTILVCDGSLKTQNPKAYEAYINLANVEFARMYGSPETKANIVSLEDNYDGELSDQTFYVTVSNSSGLILGGMRVIVATSKDQEIDAEKFFHFQAGLKYPTFCLGRFTLNHEVLKGYKDGSSKTVFRYLYESSMDYVKRIASSMGCDDVDVIAVMSPFVRGLVSKYGADSKLREDAKLLETENGSLSQDQKKIKILRELKNQFPGYWDRPSKSDLPNVYDLSPKLKQI